MKDCVLKLSFVAVSAKSIAGERMIAVNTFRTWGLLAALLAGSVGASEPEIDAPSGALAGRVVDIDGRPVAGARVWFEGQGRKTLAEARTNDGGRYRLESIPPTFQGDLLIDAGGYGREYRDEVRVFPARQVELRDVVMAPGRDVVGRILDRNGMPKAGLELECSFFTHLAAFSVGRYGPSFKVRTDAEGRFRVRDVPPCQFEATAEAPECELLASEAFIAPGSTPAVLADERLKPDAPVIGTVKDAEGRPLAGIKVETNFVGNHDAVTDAQGRFALRGIPAGLRFRTMVDAPNYTYVNRLTEGGENPVDIVLKPCAYLSGRVVDARTGDPVEFQSLSLCLARLEPGGRIARHGCRSVDSEPFSAGRFRLSCDPAEDHCLTVAAAGYEECELFVDRLTREARGDNLLVKMHRTDDKAGAGQRISGTITDGRKPVAAAWVSLRAPAAERNLGVAAMRRGRTVPIGPPFAPSKCLSAADGKFSLRVHYAGQWFVVVDEPQGRRTIVGPLEIALDESRALDIRAIAGGTVTGRVGNIPDDWQGSVWVVAFERTVHRAEVRVNKDGTFQFENLPPGEYGLKVGHDGYADPEIPRSSDYQELMKLLQTVGREPARPWQQAVVVTVTTGGTTSGIELECPRSEDR
jgi:hypothetical protein